MKKFILIIIIIYSCKISTSQNYDPINQINLKNKIKLNVNNTNNKNNLNENINNKNTISKNEENKNIESIDSKILNQPYKVSKPLYDFITINNSEAFKHKRIGIAKIIKQKNGKRILNLRTGINRSQKSNSTGKPISNSKDLLTKQEQTRKYIYNILKVGTSIKVDNKQYTVKYILDKQKNAGKKGIIYFLKSKDNKSMPLVLKLYREIFPKYYSLKKHIKIPNQVIPLKEINEEDEFHSSLLKDSKKNSVKFWKIFYLDKFPIMIKEEIKGPTFNQILEKEKLTDQIINAIKEALIKISKNNNVYKDLHGNNVMLERSTGKIIIIDTKKPIHKNNYKDALTNNINNFIEKLSYSPKYSSIFGMKYYNKKTILRKINMENKLIRRNHFVYYTDEFNYKQVGKLVKILQKAKKEI